MYLWACSFVAFSRSSRAAPRRITNAVGRRNEYQPKGGDALRLGSDGRYGLCVGGR